MNEIVELIVNVALVTMIVCLPIAGYRVRQGPTSADRLLGVDMLTTLIVGITVLLALVEQTNTTIDIGIALAALSFAATISIARYIAEGRAF